MRPINSGAETYQVANEPKEGTNEGTDNLGVGSLENAVHELAANGVTLAKELDRAKVKVSSVPERLRKSATGAGDRFLLELPDCV